MTDTGPATNPGDVVVTGQRRNSPGDPFPVREEPPSGTHIPGDEFIEPSDWDPCVAPESKLEWDTDAATREAIRQFRVKASELGDDDLYQREFNAFLYRDASGNIAVGVISAGPRVGSTSEATVGDDWTGITPQNLIGSIHSHPGGSRTPSGTDWEGFDIVRAWINQYAGQDRANEYRHYIVARDTSDASSQFLARYYDKNSSRTNTPGKEVNPEAMPCP